MALTWGHACPALRMIARRQGDLLLMDREDLAAILGRSAATIRARCTPVAYDPATRRALYDAEACQEQLASVRKRVRLRNGLRL